MDPAKLKDEYGDKLCFDRTMRVQSMLPYGLIYSAYNARAYKVILGAKMVGLRCCLYFGGI